MAMFQPEIATMWLAPAVAKSAARSRSTRSRRPMRIPAASPASGSGRACRSASPAPSRRACRLPSAGGSRMRTADARRLPEAPVRLRYSPYGSSSGGGRRRPFTSTSAPAATTGNAGRVAATSTSPSAVCRRRRATWLPSRDELIDSTAACHGPEAASGSSGEGTVGGPASTRNPSSTAPTPAAATATPRGPATTTPRERPAATASSPATSTMATGRPIAMPAAAAATPAASHALRGRPAGRALTGRRSRAPGSSRALPRPRPSVTPRPPARRTAAPRGPQ